MGTLGWELTEGAVGSPGTELSLDTMKQDPFFEFGSQSRFRLLHHCYLARLLGRALSESTYGPHRDPGASLPHGA